MVIRSRRVRGSGIRGAIHKAPCTRIALGTTWRSNLAWLEAHMIGKVWIKDAVKVRAAAALVRLLTDFTFLTSSHV